MHYSKYFKTLGLGFLLLPLLINLAWAQNKLVSVNTATGTANVQVPLFNVTYGNISVPIAAVYNAGGVKPLDVEGTAGMNWNLIVGGSVSRVLRGMPDDCGHDALMNPRIGWMYNNNQSNIKSFLIANNGVNCNDAKLDSAYIAGHFSYTSDTEPDLFNVNAPGLSCTLVYDHTINNFRPIPYQDLKISITTADSAITSFTIINDKGTKYVFSTCESAWQYTHSPASPLNYFANFYNQYVNFIDYTDAWYITSITDVNDQSVLFNYITAPGRTGSDSVRLFVAGSTTLTNEYVTTTRVFGKLLKTILTGDGDIYTTAYTLSWDTATTRSTGVTLINSISGRGNGVTFNYSSAYYYLDTSTYYKNFLRSINNGNCSSPIDYTFSYNGETLQPGGFYYNTTLSDTSAKKYDYWGYNSNAKVSIPKLYVNPSDTAYQLYVVAATNTPGSNYPYTVGVSQAMVDTVAVMAGTLDTIRYATGGMTTLTYQSNDYYDVPTGTVLKGGGIRIKQIVDHDGINEANDITRSYTYNNPATGAASSGKPASLPAYGFTIPYSGSASGQPLWTVATVIADADLSPEDHTIYYGYVKETQTHAGSTQYQYYLPATNWDKTAVPGCSGCTTVDWRPTIDYIGLTSCTAHYGPVNNYNWSYPFVPNANYDFERGLLQSVITYNDAGTRVSESDYTYQRSYATVTAIPALHYEYDGGSAGVLGYGKYNIYTTTSELPYTVTNTVFDSPTLSQAQVSTVNYTYGSANHKLLTRQSTTNSDGTTLIINMQYTKDMGATSGTGNANINALYNLVQENVNVPVETWQQVQNGSNTYTTNAALTLFGNYTGASGTLYLPAQQYKLTLPNGETSFAKSTISGTAIVKDGGYQPLPVNFTNYDYDGALMTTDDNRHHVQSMLLDHYFDKPLLTITNAYYNEYAFQNFDMLDVTSPYNYFTTTGTPSGIAGHTGYGTSLSTSQTLNSPTITKNAQANNYIFSLWINSTTVTGNITLTIKVTIGGSTTPYTKTFAATGNNWQYFEWKVPVSGAFTISAQSSGNIYIDDVLCYPETSEVTTYAYDPVTYLPVAVTNTNGISTYYAYDVWGRLLYTYDRYKNILQKNTYVTQAEQLSFQKYTSVTGSRSNYYVDTAFTLHVTLGISCPASTGTTYTWNFNDGSSPVTTTVATSPSHTYDTVKTYNPTVKVVSPLYGTLNLTVPISVTIPLPTSVPVTFNNTANSHGLTDLSSVQFYQGSTLAYSFSPATSLGTVPSGSYTVKVNMTSHASAYGSLQLSIPNGKDPTLVGCANYAASGVYTYSFPVTLPLNCPALNILELASSCSGGGGD